MNTLRRSTLVLALMLAVPIAGCSDDARSDANKAVDDAQAAVNEAAAEGGAMSQAFAEAREKLRTENLPLSAGDGVPKAELTPQGDLLINGVAVPVNAEQREAVLAFRSETLAVADAGMAMGEKGVEIAGDALALAAKGIFGGDTAEGEARIEAKGKAMETEALALCERVVALEAAQDRLASVLPAFKPYAKAIDVEADCNVADTAKDAEQQAEDAAAAPAETTEV